MARRRRLYYYVTCKKDSVCCWYGHRDKRFFLPDEDMEPQSCATALMFIKTRRKAHGIALSAVRSGRYDEVLLTKRFTRKGKDLEVDFSYRI